MSGTNFVPLTGSDSVTFTLYGRGELFGRYSGLSNVVIGGTAGYRHKFGLGYAAPWASLSVGASYDNYREDLRTGTRLDLRAETGKRFTEQFDASAGVYKKLLLRDDRLVGCVLYGDVADGAWHVELITAKEDVSGLRDGLMFGRDAAEEPMVLTPQSAAA